MPCPVFLLHLLKGPQGKSSADFKGLENQVPEEIGDSLPTIPEGHLKKDTGAVAADTEERRRRTEAGLASADHPPAPLASRMQGLSNRMAT